MITTMQKRAEEKHIEKNVFNETLDEESKLISNLGRGFTEKVKYIAQMSQRDV